MKKLFIIEYTFAPDFRVKTVFFKNMGWEIWKKYNSKKSRNEALMALNKSHKRMYMFRAGEVNEQGN